MTTAAQLKAEIVLTLQLVLRHRAVRLAGVMGVVAVALSRAPGALPALLLAIGGVLGATAASRPLAPGPAFHLARRAAASPLLVAAGRFAGVMLVVAAAVSVAVVVETGGLSPRAVRVAGAALVGSAALAAPVLALTPMVGASGAAALGILAALFGQMPPSSVAGFLDPWPVVREGAVLVWNAAPLSWRAERWLAAGAAADAGVFTAWIGIGIAGAAWALVPPRDGEGGVQ